MPVNNIETIKALVTAPRRAFEAIAEKPRWLFPLLVLLLPTLVVLVWYYLTVDLAWIIDEQMRTNPRMANLTEEQRAQVAQFSSRGTLTVTSAIAACVLVLLFRVLEATWYLLAGKVTNVNRSFRQWFALANWTSLPGVLAVIPAVLSLLLADTDQMDPGVLQPLSLNELFFHRGIGESGYQLLSSVGLLQVLGAALAIIGVHTWSRRSWLHAAVIVLLPVGLILGPWAYFSLGRA